MQAVELLMCMIVDFQITSFLMLKFEAEISVTVDDCSRLFCIFLMFVNVHIFQLNFIHFQCYDDRISY